MQTCAHTFTFYTYLLLYTYYALYMHDGSHTLYRHNSTWSGHLVGLSLWLQVYQQTLRAAGVPDSVLASHDLYLSNMVGLVRGNLYYNLMNWYRCLSCLPLGDTSKYMETMMGVKQVWDSSDRFLTGRDANSCVCVFVWVWVGVCVLFGRVWIRNWRRSWDGSGTRLPSMDCGPRSRYVCNLQLFVSITLCSEDTCLHCVCTTVKPEILACH